MDEWQPVRLAPVEQWNKYHPGAEADTDFHAAGKIIRVRPCGMPLWMRKAYAIMGCDLKRTFLIHPEDAERLNIHSAGTDTWVCEHQILAD